MKSVIAATLKNLESQVAALRAALNEIPTEASPQVQPKEKRELSAAILKMNGERGAIFEELKAAWSSAHPEYVALDAAALKSAVKSGAVPAKPRFSDALQEHSRRLRENDPAKQAKYEAYRKSADAKTAKIQAARAAASEPVTVSAPASVTSTSEKKERKNPWLDLTDEQKKERIAKMQTGKLAKKEAALVAAPVAAPVAAAPSVPAPSASNPFDDAAATEAPASDTESATSSKKRGPPKGVKLSEEERIKRAAKAKATRDAKKVAGAAAVPLPASPPSSSASSVIVDEIDEETFTKQQIGSKIVYKNALGHVRAYTTEGAGIWLGMYDPVKKVIDASVPEPSE